MEFLYICLVGLILSFGMKIAISKLEKKECSEKSEKYVRIIRIIRPIVEAVVVGGIAGGTFLFHMEKESEVSSWTFDNFEMVLCFLLGAVYWVRLIISFCKSIIPNDCLKVRLGIGKGMLIVIVSSFVWNIPISNYFQNIEIKPLTVLEQTEERQLFYFCNIPVQNVTGEINTFSGTGGGSISTSDQYAYIYNENGQGQYDTAPAKEAKLDFLSDGTQTPFIQILSKYSYQEEINHNNGKSSRFDEKRWKEYIFHIPETVKQYQLE